MPVFRQMVGPWSETVANAWYLPGDVLIVVLLYTWFNRIPEAGSVFRFIWRHGRALIIGVYLWSAFWLVWLNQTALMRSDHRHFSAVVVLLAIDLLIIAFVYKSTGVKATFADFPLPADANEKAVQGSVNPAVLRQQLIQQALIEAPVFLQTAPGFEVEQQLRALLITDPHNGMAWLELGVLAYQQQKIDHAEALMRKALDEAPNNPLILRSLCELLRQQGRVAQAIGFGHKAVELAPQDEIAQLNLAVALTDNKDWDQAIYHYHRLLELSPNHVQAWLSLAVLLLQQNRNADAHAALEAVLLLEPGNAQAIAFKQSLL